MKNTGETIAKIIPTMFANMPPTAHDVAKLVMNRVKPARNNTANTIIPELPFHRAFYPGSGQGLGFDDLKLIEAYQFSQWITEGRQGEPGFAEVLAVAGVQDAIMRSWETGGWEQVRSLRRG